jgi:hypothetical protein
MKISVTRILAFGFIASLIIAVISVPNGNAQIVNGTLQGAVHDQQGAVVPGAPVSSRNTDTGAVRETKTDSNGDYSIPSVSAGPYQVTVAAPGFKTEVRGGIIVTVGASIRVDFALTVGAVQEQVTVTAEAPQVDTVSSTMSGLVNEATIRELPLNGRDWLQLAQLQPGTAFFRGQNQSDVSRLPRGEGQAISISGGRPSENAYLLDGLIMNDFANQSPGSSLGVNLGVDAIREFSVLTDTYSAQFGRASGGVVNSITKSGTNDLHGSAFEFIRNSALDARNYFDGLAIPPFRRNQFGGALGGPIRKNKTFFFADYEGLREFRSLSFNSTTLSANARNGILTTGTVTVDPRVKPYLALYPLPSTTNGDTGQFIFGGGRTASENFVIGKVDHSFTPNTTLSGTYRFDFAQAATPDNYDEKLTSTQTHNQNFIVSLQHIFSPTLLNNIRAGVTRAWDTDGFDINPQTPLVTDTTLGFVPGRTVGEFTNILNGFFFGGIGDTGADVVGYTSPQVYDDLQWTRGRHSLKFGFGFEKLFDDVNPQTTPNGAWSFGSLSNMLTAVPNGFTAAVPGTDTQRGLRTTILAGYAQDDFRFRPNLTFNLGVRYETSSAVSEVHGKLGNLRDLASPTAAEGNPLFQNPTLRNFEPRIGLAWDPFKDGKTSVRSGFGIYDVLPLPYLFWNKATHGLPFFELGVVNVSPSNQAAVNAAFPGNGLSLIQPGTLRVAYVEYNPHRSYKMQWNLNVQRQLTSTLSLTVGYVGSSSEHLPVGQNDADQVPPSLVKIVPGNGGYGGYQFPTTGTIPRINPNFGRIDATFFNGHSSYHALQASLSKRMSYGLSFQANYTWSKSIDNASTFFSQSETLNSTDNPYIFDPRINRAVSDFDIPQYTAVSITWQIPKHGSFKGAADFLLNGWQFGGILTAQSGSPFEVGLNTDRARTGTSTKTATSGERPNYNPTAPGCNNSPVTGDPKNYINTSCFSFPALGTLGSLGRNTLRSPFLEEFDFSVFKNHAFFNERLNTQFRAEMFNIFNHPNLLAQTTTLLDSSGGVIPNSGVLQPPTATTSRQIQFGLRFVW